ncbi:MAG: hypothetical protein WC261_10490 [Synergistaceae bacterium]|jgi:hypothetical protein
MAKCYDCGFDYEDPGWIEAIIPDQIWNEISPTKDQGGILCILCISKRLAEKGYKDIPVWLCGTEPIRPIMGDPGDNKFSLDILRNWIPAPLRGIG